MHDKNENDNSISHPAWEMFINEFAPALNETDCQEALTGDQIISYLNSIAYAEFFSSSDLVALLRKHKFNSKILPNTSTCVWLLKAPLKLSFK